MLKINVLGCDSSGNAYVFKTEDYSLCIDAGVRVPNDCDVYLLSHDHSDHKKFWDKIDRTNVRETENISIVQAATLDKSKKLHLKFYSLLHHQDGKFGASTSTGFSFVLDNKNVLFLTDFCFIDDAALKAIKSQKGDVVCIECNHDIKLPILQHPFTAKGHCSNDYCWEILQQLEFNANAKVVYMHLSNSNVKSFDDLIYGKDVLSIAGVEGVIARKNMEIGIDEKNDGKIAQPENVSGAKTIEDIIQELDYE